METKAAFLLRDGGLCCWFRAMHFDLKDGVASLFAMTFRRGIMIRIIVCPHVR